MALKHVWYHIWNESSVQIWCMIQDARGWCTGMTQRDGMGREVGRGFRMGNMYTPVVDSCWCMAKPLQYCKVISNYPIKINKFIFFKKEESWVLKNWCFFFFNFILLYSTVLVLPYINMNPPRVYTCSQSWTPFPPPSPYLLSGSSQCTSPKHPVSWIITFK